MKIGYLTTYFPYRNEEQFFEAEVRSLARLATVFVIPLRTYRAHSFFPEMGATPYVIGTHDGAKERAERREFRGLPRTVEDAVSLVDYAPAALREFRRDPRRALRALGRLLSPNYRLRSKIVNLMAYPKALALADEIRRLQIDHLHANWLTTPGTSALIAADLVGIPFSLSAHQHDIFADNLLSEKVAASAFVRVISERNRSYLLKQIPSSLHAHCTTIHLGVELPSHITEPPGRKVKILCAARMCVWKGHRYLLQALATLRDRGREFTCDFAGDGEIREEVSRMIEQLGLSGHVRMLGKIPHDELVSRLNDAEWDIFALASTERPGEHEGIPVAVMEAMAAGLPVVSTQTGSLDELLDSESGFLVPQRDPSALAAAFEPLLLDPELRRRMGRRGRQRVLEDFETSRTTAQLFTLIQRTTPSAKSSAPLDRSDLYTHNADNLGYAENHERRIQDLRGS
ncbi:MAG TPA: glycosyltransferase [Candidatus Baltobacteraceae bacterium]|jgi:glycosyltransferase involved in cell wall biosynthesis|nr:glycosyltransferase [Candidatus Baltobacteraceae bacterium]